MYYVKPDSDAVVKMFTRDQSGLLRPVGYGEWCDLTNRLGTNSLRELRVQFPRDWDSQQEKKETPKARMHQYRLFFSNTDITTILAASFEVDDDGIVTFRDRTGTVTHTVFRESLRCIERMD